MADNHIIDRWRSLTPQDRDVWVARKVFGAHIVKCNATFFDESVGWTPIGSPAVPGLGVYYAIPRFTTKREAAQMVVAKMRNHKNHANFMETSGEAQTPDAICLAALLELSGQGSATL